MAADGPLRLFGVNQVATRKAQLTGLSTPTVYKGEDEVKARFRNTGNVPFKPTGEVQVRPVVGGRPGAVALRRPVEVATTKPGATGEAGVELPLPGSAPAYQVTVRLVSEGRQLDSRDVTVTPRDKPPLLTRAKQFVTDHALLLVGALLLVIVLGLGLGARYLRRLKAVTAGAGR